MRIGLSFGCSRAVEIELSICQSLLCLDLVSFPVLTQIKPVRFLQSEKGGWGIEVGGEERIEMGGWENGGIEMRRWRDYNGEMMNCLGDWGMAGLKWGDGGITMGGLKWGDGGI